MDHHLNSADLASGRAWVELLAECANLFGPTTKLRTILVLMHIVRLGEASCQQIISQFDLPHNSIRNDLKRLSAIDRHGNRGLRLVKEERDRITGELFYRPTKCGHDAAGRLIAHLPLHHGT